LGNNENMGNAVMTTSNITTEMRTALRHLAALGETVTYQGLASALNLAPPNTIRQVTSALEILMAEDVAAGRPMIAALVVRKGGAGLPARGFFEKAAELGRFEGDPMGDAAEAFYRVEFAAMMAFWGQSSDEVIAGNLQS
jgi:hypothetical protein